MNFAGAITLRLQVRTVPHKIYSSFNQLLGTGDTATLRGDSPAGCEHYRQQRSKAAAPEAIENKHFNFFFRHLPPVSGANVFPSL